MGMRGVVLVRLVVLWVMVLKGVRGGNVTYDGRALIIDGTRRILFSGSIHYPRSTPEMWPALVGEAKAGGLDVIQTYVFWNVHEPIQGQYNFQGRYDLVKFIKVIRDQGLYVSLRIGPFIEAEWKYGGLPFWLHDIPSIVFRCDNEPFKSYMMKFVTMIVNMMKSEGLYASQGGPILLSQIENEYQLVEAAFHDKGPHYVTWAASMAVGLQTGVPWVMCKQDDAPDPVINTCNGMKCGETFAGPNSPTKPSLWTENWTTMYTKVGEEPKLRSAEDIAFQTALFIARNGSFVNYYMYHGGTNFGRSASAYTTTSYYDQAPLDEYGLVRQPKWGHLKDLHAAIKLSSEPLLLGTHTKISLGPLQEATVFEVNPGKCTAFLINKDKKNNVTVQFRNVTYQLPQTSISILPDCKNVVYNTAKVSAGYSVRSARTVQHLGSVESWGAFSDGVVNIANSSFTKRGLREQMATTKDVTDYLWYTVSYIHNSGDDQKVLHVYSRGHVVHAYVNGVLVGSEHGSHDNPGAVLEKPISLKVGKNNISLLSVMVGLPDSGAYMERRAAGISRVKILGKNNQSLDLTNHLWGYKVGLLGESLKIYTEEGSNNVKWNTITGVTRPPLMWYKTTFDAPLGNDPVAFNLSSMGKGEAWINGESIGRYWVSFKTPKGWPAQSLYHIPRSFLRPSGNLLALFEEEGGDPLQVTIETVTLATVETVPVPRECDFASESYSSSQLSQQDQQHSIHLQCYGGKNISSIEFASYGNPHGECQKYAMGACHAAASKTVVEMFCLGREDCSVSLSTPEFGADPCPGTPKTLLVAASCN